MELLAKFTVGIITGGVGYTAYAFFNNVFGWCEERKKYKFKCKKTLSKVSKMQGASLLLCIFLKIVGIVYFILMLRLSFLILMTLFSGY